MKLEIVVREAEEGGHWAEVPALPGCVSQGETMDELLENMREAIRACGAARRRQPSRTAAGGRAHLVRTLSGKVFCHLLLTQHDPRHPTPRHGSLSRNSKGIDLIL